MKRVLTFALITVATITVAYGEAQIAAQTPLLAGSWEMIMTMYNPFPSYGGPQTRFELGFTQQHSSRPNLDSLTSECPASMGACGVGLYFGDVVNDFGSHPWSVSYDPFSYCNLTMAPKTVTGTIDAAGRVNLSIGYWVASGRLQPNGAITGTYKFANSGCSPWGIGTFVARRVNSLSGEYANDLLGNSSLTFAMNEWSASATLPALAHLRVRGSDSVNGTYWLSGQANGNFIAISGLINSQKTYYWGMLVKDVQLGPLLVVFDTGFQVVCILRKVE